jgi:nicotinate-nucleotide adenylyltransferase
MAIQRRVGIFGGAFDPPHRTHVALAQAAVAQLNLDELRVIPTGDAWHKSRALSPAVHRTAMARLAFAAIPQAVIDEREVQRDGPTYTIDTLRELRAEMPDSHLFLLMGGDQARALPSWREWREIVTCATICVADRQDQAAKTDKPEDFTSLVGQFVPVHLPPSPVSATDIRLRVAAGQDVSPLATPAVASYIAQHHLYQNH